MYAGDELYSDDITSGELEELEPWDDDDGSSYEEATGDFGQWD